MSMSLTNCGEALRVVPQPAEIAHPPWVRDPTKRTRFTRGNRALRPLTSSACSPHPRSQLGLRVAQFESSLAIDLITEHTIGVGPGMAAQQMALERAGIGPSDGDMACKQVPLYGSAQVDALQNARSTNAGRARWIS